jgi:hypothetical protein
MNVTVRADGNVLENEEAVLIVEVPEGLVHFQPTTVPSGSVDVEVKVQAWAAVQLEVKDATGGRLVVPPTVMVLVRLVLAPLLSVTVSVSANVFATGKVLLNDDAVLMVLAPTFQA